MRELAVVALLLLPGIASAASQLDCTLTVVESEANSNFSTGEKHPITIETDEDRKAITVSQDGRKQVLDHVTFTLLSINGYTADMSLGLDRASGNVVLQSYGADSNKIEFGTCTSKATGAVIPK